MSNKPIAKSLPTVSVLVNVSLFLTYSEPLTLCEALQMALRVLHLHDKPDAYGLIEQARKQLLKADPTSAILVANNWRI